MYRITFFTSSRAPIPFGDASNVRIRAAACFKAARTIDGLLVDIRDIYKEKGRAGLLTLDNVGEKLTGVIEGLLR
ncbi:hypothetical protein GF338_02245 [candidate division WOR-3 bacterium]|nr:hypothetical protein [candidate division WOR-3 bacterium]